MQFRRIIEYGRMIKFSHTIFALPFALSAVLLAWQNHALTFSSLVWILLAMTGARSAAMGFNRIVDSEIDLKNPRTALREIPAGILSRNEAKFFVILSSLIFIFASAMLSKLCFYLSCPLLFFLFFYSYTKRFTSWCHIYLGFAISMAPIGAWIAITGSLTLGVIFLSLALMTYISGFDILYACQDMEFDRDQGLYSIPAKLGYQKATKLSSLLHLMTMFFFVAMAVSFKVHVVFWIFLIIISILLILAHLIVHPHDFTRINIAFFHINALISVCLLTGIILESLLC